MAEAVRIQLDTLYQHGCYRRLDDARLLAEVARIADDPKDFASSLGVESLGERGVVATYRTGFRDWIALYRWGDGKVRTLIVVTGEAGNEERQLLILGYTVFQPPGETRPLLALANTHPWASSCWRSLRFRVLAPSGDPFRPDALLNWPHGGRWCEGVKVTAEGDTVSFVYDDWGGPWSRALVQRTYTRTYQIHAGALAERFGFPFKLEHLAEDWLMRSWSLAAEATIEEARDRLKPIHDALRDRLIAQEKARASGPYQEYTSQLFKVSDTERRLVLYCAVADTGKPCADWPRPVDFLIERRLGIWRVKEVKPRP